MKHRRQGRKKFWEREYKKPGHLALSTEPSSDLQKFTRWLGRRGYELGRQSTVLDLGCGNGRNLIWLAKEFGCRGVGYDSSREAIAQAGSASANFFQVLGNNPQTVKKTGTGVTLLPLNFQVRSLAEPLPLDDQSVDLALDLMSSHVLKAGERAKFRDEIWRVLRPGGWLYFKTFLLDGDRHATRLLREHPSGEAGTYHHPTFDHDEHVWTLEEIEDFFLPQFEIHRLDKSHKHLSRGQAFRRRTISVYLQKRD